MSLNISSIIDRHTKDVHLTRQSCDSFDDFINNRINEIISELQPIDCTYFGPTETREISIRILNASVKQPVMLEYDGTSRPIYPNECRLRDLTLWCTKCTLILKSFEKASQIS